MERRLKRTAWKRVTSFVASTFLAATAVVVPQTWNAQEAAAYVLNENLPVNHGTPDGPQPRVARNSVNIEGSPYKPGDRFTYDVTSMAKAPEWEDGRQGNTLEEFTLTLTVPKVAPLTREPSSSDFVWSDGVRRNIESQNRRDEGENYVYTFEFDVRGHGRGANDLTVEASLPAQIDSTITDNQNLSASVDTRVTADDLGIKWPGSTDLNTFLTNDRCVRTFSQTKTHSGKGVNGDGYGSWLIHAKSGSNTDNLVPAGPITVEFENAQGVELVQPEYKPNDSSPALFASTNYGVRPGNVWKSSAGWEYNPETKTGTQWVADGTRVTMYQNYRDLNCSNYGTPFWAYGGEISFGIESAVAPRVSRDGAESRSDFEVNAEEAAFEVTKVADGRRSKWVAPKASPVEGEDDTYRANYTVTVKNTGGKEGTSGAIVDTPAEVPGYEIVGVQVDGSDVEIVGGKLQLSDGETLRPSATREFKITADYKRLAEATADELENAGKCDFLGPDPSQSGVVNTVTLVGEDETKSGDNHDCVEIPAEPAFNVTKVAKDRKGADRAPSAVPVGDDKYRADYTVSVVNIGGVEGTFGRVTDQPKEIDGFEIVEVTVDGETVQAGEDGYLVSEGEVLAPGTPTKRGTKDFKVSVTYQRTEDATPEQLENAAKCDPASQDEPSKTGAVNVAQLDGERDDLRFDNDDCVEIPQQPEFNVKKEAVKQEAERLPNGSYRARYTITVENIGQTPGRFDVVSDNAYSGNRISPSSFQVNGHPVRAVSPHDPGYFIVSTGGHLQPGEKAVFDVDVFYTVQKDATDEEWDKVATCELGEDGKYTSGAHNTAKLGNEAPGLEDDNSDCVVIERKPTFEVKKEAADAVATRNDDGSYTANYTITVGNTSPVAGTSGEILDSPREQPGFTITSVKVDNNEIAVEDGRYLVSSGAELEGGSTKSFQVAVTYKPNDDITSDQWSDAGVCEAAEGEETKAQHGLVNVVRLVGGTPGKEGDNAACVTVDGAPAVDIKKSINGKDANFAADAPVVAPGEDMNIVYTVTNTGNVALKGVHVVDEVTEGAAKDELQQAIDAELKKQDAVDLEPGESKDFTVTVKATKGGHVNVARPTVPVTVPGTTEPGTTVPGTTQQVPSTTPSDSGRVNDPQVAITKLINGEDANEPESAVTVAAGAPMTISYVVSNPGNVDLKGVNVVDVVEGEDNADLQADIDQALEGVEPFDLAAGESTTVTVEVDAPAGAHKNVARPTVPPVTIPGTTVPDTTVPGTTVPGTTNATTTDPGTTKPGTTVPGTTVPSTVVTVTTPSDPGHSTPEPKAGLEVKKYINGRDAESLDDAAAIVPGDDMVITYRVVNTGNVDYFGLALADTVTQSPEGALGEAIAKQLDEHVGTFDLPAGQGREFTITVTAEEGTHENEVVVEVPSTVPGTTNATTTNPGTTNPVPSTVPSDKGGSKDYALRIKKYVDGFDAEASGDASATVVPTVTPGADMVIRYVVENTGNTALSGVRIVDEVEGDSEAADKLQQDIEQALADKVVDLEPKTSEEVEITVPAPAEAHVNFAHPVAVTTVPEVTIPATTLPGTTIPETVVSSTVVTVTAPKDRGASTPTVDTPKPEPTPEPNPQLEIVKTINGKDANFAADAPVVAPGEDMNIVYTVTNTGNVALKGVHVVDEVTEGAAKDELQQAIDAELKKQDAVDLEPGESKDFTVTVKATKGGHVNVARPTVPVTVPGTTEPGTTVPGTTQQVPSTTPSDSGRVNDPQVAITKLINGEDANEPESAVTVAAGAPMTISYVVSNPGNVDLKGVNVVDVVEGEDNADLQADIDQALEGVEPFDLAAGESTTVTVEVDAPAGAHKNVARPTVPPVTIPGTTVPDTTVPGTTVPGTTNATTTDPGTTKPGTTVPGTTVPSTVVTVTTPSDPGHSTPEPKAGLEVKKYINGRDDNALVTAGEDMEITYRVTNTGETTIDGIRLLDEVKEDNADLQQQIDAQLGKQPSFGLAPGESREVTVTVKAPVGRHDNAVRVTVPPVTVPGTTVPDTTVPGTTGPNTTEPGTTVPGTTVPGTVVTVTAPPDDASSDSPQLAILKEIKAGDEDEDAWRDAEEAADALPVAPGADMQLRYTVTNTGSVDLAGIDVVDSVTRLDDGDADAFAELINQQLAAEGRGFALAPGESKAIVITVAAPEGYHVNEAIATAPPVTATETVVTSVPGTTDATTTVPGAVTTETTVVERVPNTPVDKAQSTPTVDTTPCNCTPVTTTVTPSPVTVTRTTPVTTVQTITPEPSTVVTTVVATPTPTTTPGGATVVVTPATTTPTPGRVIVIVDEGGNTVTRITPAPEEGGSPSETVTHTIPGGKTTTTLTTEPGGNTVNKCVANAVRSPILYMVPLVLAGQVLGDAAAPYIAQFNDQFNKINAEIQEEIRRNTPDLGFGRRGHENEQVAQLRARLDEANRQLDQLANMPEVREYGKWAAVALGVVVAGSVLYDWCTNEEGEAFTAIGPKKTTTIDDVRVGGSSLLGRGDAATSVAPVTQTPEGETTDGDVEADAGSADSSSAGLGDGSSDGSSEGSSGSSDGSSEGSSGSSDGSSEGSSGSSK